MRVNLHGELFAMNEWNEMKPGLLACRLRLLLRFAFSQLRAIRNNDIVNNVPY